MATPSSFLKIGSYLPSVVLVATALMFGGLREWVSAGWVELEDAHPPPGNGKAVGVDFTSEKKWVRRRRDLLDAFIVMAASHLIGLSLFGVIFQGWFDILRQLVCSSVLVSLFYWLMSVQERDNSPRLLDNSHARPMEIPFAWQKCTNSTASYPFEGYQHVPCEHAHFRFVGSQFLPRRTPCSYSRHSPDRGVSVEFSIGAWRQMWTF